MEKCDHQKVSLKFFLLGKTQKHKVFQDVSSPENIPTLEQCQESDSTCKGIDILYSSQLSVSVLSWSLPSLLNLKQLLAYFHLTSLSKYTHCFAYSI